MEDLLVKLAGFLFLVGFVPYAVTILKGDTQPVRVTWFTWFIMDIFLMIGMIKSDALNGLMVGATIGAGIIALLSIKYGRRGWNTWDILCLFGTGAGVGLLLTLSDPTISMIVILAVMGVGSIPTIQHAIKEPHAESLIAWSLFTSACILDLFLVDTWNVNRAGQPILFGGVDALVVVILILGRRT